MKLTSITRHLFFTFSVLSSLAVLETVQTFVPKGTILGTFEVIATLLTSLILVNRGLREPRKLLVFFGFSFLLISGGDFLFIWYYYFQQIGIPTDFHTIIIELTYIAGLTGLVSCICSFFDLPRQIFRNTRNLTVLLLVFPVATPFFIALFSGNPNQTWIYYLLEYSAVTLKTLLFLLSALIFLNDTSRFWSSASVSFMTMVMAGWGIRVDKLLGVPIEFGVYEFLWAFGLFNLLVSTFSTSSISNIRFNRSKSVIFSVRQIILLSSFLAVVSIAVLQTSAPDTVRTLTLTASVGIVLAYVFSELLLNELKHFSATLLEILSDRLSDSNNINQQFPEELKDSLEGAIETKIEIAKKSVKFERDAILAKKIAETSKQVAHDIRSPLAALKMVAHSKESIPEDLRQILTSATKRIRDISDDLTDSTQRPSRSPQIILIAETIREIFEETKLRFHRTTQTIFTLDIASEVECLFCFVSKVELSRVISNLLVNAVESQPSIVTLRLQRVGANGIQIQVVDNGRGVPLSIRNNLFERGFTFGKKDGTGIGLFHAKEFCDQVDGSIAFSENKIAGTVVTLSLPVAINPEWAASALTLYNSTIVILDDVQAIHDIWRSRLVGYSLVHLYHPSELGSFLSNDPAPAHYLIDFEFTKSKIDGLSVVEKHSIASSSLLVTSHFDSLKVQKRATQLGVKILAKPLAGFVEIAHKNSHPRSGGGTHRIQPIQLPEQQRKNKSILL